MIFSVSANAKDSVIIMTAMNQAGVSCQYSLGGIRIAARDHDRAALAISKVSDRQLMPGRTSQEIALALPCRLALTQVLGDRISAKY